MIDVALWQIDERLIDANLRIVLDASRGDQADHERAVERGWQGDRDDPPVWHRMITHDAVSGGVAA